MTPRALPRAAAAAALLTVTALATGCSGATAPLAPALSAPTTDSRQAWLARGGCHEVERPGGPASSKVVLTVSAGAGHPASRYSLADLDAMPQVSCTVDDRQAEGREVTFTGPLVSTVLADAGVSGSPTLHTSALNDYVVDVPTSDAHDVPLLLATRLEGKPMTVAHYGPTRFVYPTTGFDLDPVVYDPRWVWQLRSIEARRPS